VNILKKLTSRKFILAVTGVAAGLYLALFGGDGSEIVELVRLISGLLTAAGCGISYIHAEAKVDAAAAREARK
jgi:hypothetical protein